jgi:hypothetical protein
MISPVPGSAPAGPLLPAGNPRIAGMINITEESFADGGRVEGRLKGVAECTRYRFRRRTREDCTMHRDWLPSTKPRGECGHDREFR